MKPEPVDREIDAELESHFEGTVELLVGRGWSEDEARAEARRRFGDVDSYRRDLRRIDRRRDRRNRARHAVALVGASVASAVRSLRRAPGFAAAVLVTLALGLGANAAVFRVADRLLLSPPEHVADPGAVRLLSQSLIRDDGGVSTLTAFAWSDVEAVEAAGLPATVAAGVHGMSETLGEGDGATRVRVLRVDEDWFPLVGVGPRLGRGFAPEDHRPDAAPVALLGHGLWASRFGADPGVLGRVVRVGEGRYEVVGVLPPGFVGADPPATDVWLPLEVSARDFWGDEWKSDANVLAFRIYLRLDDPDQQPAVEEAARAAMAAARESGYLLRSTLSSVDAWSLVPGDGPEPNAMIRVSRWLAAVAGLVLLVACANVANLFLAHGERVRHEVTLRRALGAGRGRLMAELLARSLVLALLGGAAALLMAWTLGGALERLFLEGIELGGRVRSGRLAGFVALTAVGAAVLAGVIPALAGPRADLRGALDTQGRGTTGGSGLRRVLVGVQAALSAMLLVGALLFVGSLRTALDLDLGFDADRVVVVRPERDTEDPVETALLYQGSRAALEALDGVESVTETVAIPFMLLYGQTARRPDQEPDETPFAEGLLRVNAVGADYFRTMGTEVFDGRAIEESDLREGAEPVAVVGRLAAEGLWPDESPLGKCLVVGSGDGPCVRIVGIAEEQAGTRQTLQEFTPGRPDPAAWVPLPVAGRGPTGLLIRVRNASEGTLEAVRRTVLSLPGVRYAEVTPLNEMVERQLRSWRLGATVFSLFGAVALIIAVLGLYGVLTYEVARRRREIGIRMALGAHAPRLAGAVLLPALATVAAGLAVALPAAAWVAVRLEGLLYHVSPHSPAVFAGTAGALLLGALISALVPAWRATHVDPRESLRE